MRFAWIEEPPFNVTGVGGVPTGCDVALAKHAFTLLGETFEPQSADFADLLPGLSDGRWDVTTGMFVTPDRRLRASFTRPIWTLRDGLLVRRADADRLTGYRQLAESGARVAVLEGQVQHRTALALGVRAERIVVFKSYAEAAAALSDDHVAAYASVALAHHSWVETHEDFACITVPDDEKAPEAGAFACATPALRDRLDQVLGLFIGSTDHIRLLHAAGVDPAGLGL